MDKYIETFGNSNYYSYICIKSEKRHNVRYCGKDNGRNSKTTPKKQVISLPVSEGFFIKLWQDQQNKQ